MGGKERKIKGESKKKREKEREIMGEGSEREEKRRKERKE